METVVLPPETWRPLLGRDLSSLPAEQNAQAKTMLEFLHERHVGFTPGLTSSLTVWLSQRDARIQATGSNVGPWPILFDRLHAELYNTGDLAKGRGRNVQIWSYVSPYILLSQIILPLGAEVCRKLSLNILFGSSSFGEVAKVASSYDEYDAAFNKVFISLIESEREMPPIFWIRGAYALLSQLMRQGGYEVRFPDRPPTTYAAQAVGTAEIDAALMGMIRRFDPQYERYKRTWRRISRRLRRSKQERQGLRPQEGGVEGIRQSRRIEDIGEMSLSELLNPIVVMLDRILHEGYVVRHRPPVRQPQRDVLLIGLMPTWPRTDSERFAKAVWLDAMFRIAIILRGAGLTKSDLRWIEATGSEHVTCAAVDLQRSPPPAFHSPWDIERNAIADFMLQAGWLPGWADQLPMTSMRSAQSFRGDIDRDSMLAQHHSWLNGAMQVISNVVPAIPLSRGRTLGKISGVDDFSIVHAFIFLPELSSDDAVFQPEWAEERVALLASLGLEVSRDQSVSLCLVPPMLRRNDAFRIWPRQEGEGEIVVSDEPEFGDSDCLNDTAGALGASLMGVALEAINGN